MGLLLISNSTYLKALSKALGSTLRPKEVQLVQCKSICFAGDEPKRSDLNVNFNKAIVKRSWVSQQKHPSVLHRLLLEGSEETRNTDKP